MAVVLNLKVTEVTWGSEQSLTQANLNRLIVVVPTQRRVRYLSRELVRLIPGAVVSTLPLYTLESLGLLLFNTVSAGKRIVAGPLQTMIFHNVVSSNSGTLQYFALRGHEPQLPRGTFDKVVHVIKHLKESGVSAAVLEEEVESAPEHEQHKLRDIITLYNSYEEMLRSIHCADMEGIFSSLHLDCSQQTFEKTFRLLFPDVHAVSLSGFDQFSAPEMGFIGKLCAIPDLSISLMFDFHPGNPALFGHLEENYKKFCQAGFVESGVATTTSEPDWLFAHVAKPPGVNSRGHELTRRLFASEVAKEKLQCRDQITLVKARNREDEVDLICKTIKRLTLTSPQRDLSRVCIATYQPQLYTDILRERCESYGIPVNITDRFSLSRSPVVTSLLSLLRIAIHGFRRQDVLEAFASPYFDFRSMDLESDLLAVVSSKLKIMGGYVAWLGRIDKRIDQVEHAFHSTAADETAILQRETGELKKARAAIESMHDLLHEVGRDGTPQEFQERFSRLLDRLQVDACLVTVGSSISQDHVERDVRAYARLLEIVKDEVELLELRDDAQIPRSLKFYVDHLTIAISQERYNVRERVGLGVLVTSIEETRGLPVDVMIVAGLVDGEFPSVYQPELFFSVERQKQREQHHVWENRYLFYQAITNWSEHLYLTYPAQEGGLDLVRSNFVDSLLKIADVEQWSHTENLPFGDVLYSEEDVLRYYGENVCADRSLRNKFPEALAPKLESIERAIAVEESRAETHVLPQYEGLLFSDLSDSAKARLAQLTQRTFSVSQLETYGKCPYRFFAQRLLRLGAVEDLREDLTPIEKGSVLHEALFEFYTSRRDLGLPSLALCSDTEYEQAIRELIRITEEKLSQIDIPDAFWEVEKEMILGDPGSGRGLLRDFLETERSRKTQVEPRYFEVSFGRAGSHSKADRLLSTDEPVLAGNVKLRGKVDRVEVSPGVFTVVDYKTGKDVAKIDDIRQGISLQLPLYLHVIEQLLERTLHSTFYPAAGSYYLLRHPVKMQLGFGNVEYNGTAFEASRRSPQLLQSDEEMKAFIAEAIERVAVYVDNISHGKFPLTTPDKVEKVCTYCEYKTICRIQTVEHVRMPDPEET